MAYFGQQNYIFVHLMYCVAWFSGDSCRRPTPGGYRAGSAGRVSHLTTEKIKKPLAFNPNAWYNRSKESSSFSTRCGPLKCRGCGEMTLSEALKTIAKRSNLTYVRWGELAGALTYGIISSPITRNDAKVSTLVKLANAAGYDVLLVRRHQLEHEDPIVIDHAGRPEKGPEVEQMF